MAKPRLEKVEALFYVLKQVAKGGCIRILIHPLFSSPNKKKCNFPTPKNKKKCNFPTPKNKKKCNFPTPKNKKKCNFPTPKNKKKLREYYRIKERALRNALLYSFHANCTLINPKHSR